MDGNLVISVEGVSKKFCKSLKRGLFYGVIDVLRSMLGVEYDLGKLRKSEFWAMDDISFELQQGESLGIIGLNGSGKTTLLRLLNGILPPDRGKIEINGRTCSLIAVGAGFHPHMTGKENIYLNGTILDMTKQEIKSKYASIVEFAEIKEFIDTPIAMYSSGMIVRLGFSIAMHCDPDLLFIDEVLNVSDIRFRNKCINYLTTKKGNYRGLIIVSHNLEFIRILCSRTIVLHKGAIIYDGETENAIKKYQNMTFENSDVNINKENNGVFRIQL